MKKIVFVIESLHLGGAEKSLVTLLQNLDYTKYKVDLITFHPGGLFRALVPAEVGQITISLPSLSFIDRLRFLLKRRRHQKTHTAQLFWTFIHEYLNKHSVKYDVAIAYNQGFATYYTAEFLTTRSKYAWVNTDYQKAGYQMALDYPFYKKFNKVIAVSPQGAERFQTALQQIKKELSLEIIKDITDKNTVKIQANQPLKRDFPEDRIKIVSVGRLVKPKGFDLAVSACSLLKSRGHQINWYVIGEGAERQNLEQLITDKNLNDHFFLLGADANPYPYMKAGDLYVQTSLFEGLGLTVIEASYLNKPIVCTNFPTVYDILVDEETGLIAEMNAESIATQIERLILDNELKNRLSMNLSKLENKDKEITLQKFEKLLFQL